MTRMRRNRFARPKRTSVKSRIGQVIARVTLGFLVLGGALVQPQLTGLQAAEAATPQVPEVFSFLSYKHRIDDVVDAFRASLVIKMPHGYVNEKTGELQQIDGEYMRIGYDYRGNVGGIGGALRGMRYINTYAAAGADKWARNVEEYYTVHKVIRAGASDFLVISIEGDMDIPRNAANNIPGGRSYPVTLYLGKDKSLTPSTNVTQWISKAQTKFTMNFLAYHAAAGPTNVSGPLVQMQTDGSYGLWTKAQANWAQVIDFGLNGTRPGVLPANSIPVDLVNYAYTSTASGAAGSVSDSFWYAWVHDDGSLVTDINTAPIHVTGVTPSALSTGQKNVVKNIENPPGTPSLSYTPEAAAQGLTKKVAPTGEVDFRDAGGTGYYRLLTWPESRDPDTVTVDNGARKLSYTKGDLFQNGKLTVRGKSEAWAAGSAFYRFDIRRPEPPLITTPANGLLSKQNAAVEISGTGLPGHSISLKFVSGRAVTSLDDPRIETIVDGDRECAQAKCEVMVQENGTWSYTYRPAAPLADGPYAVVALQTEQSTMFNVTSGPSNPSEVGGETEWGANFEIDTVSPVAPIFPCVASPTQVLRPALSGSGVENGARVWVYLDQKRIGEARVTGDSWEYVFTEDLVAGKHDIAVMQVDRAGNESPLSSPACSLEVIDSVNVSGTKAVIDVAHPAAGLPPAAPGNWEIVLSEGVKEHVINGGKPFEAARGVEYSLSERPRQGADPTATLYSQRGRAVCLDSAGGILPVKIFDPETQKLKIGPEDQVKSPVNCTVSNQTAQSMLLTKNLGGITAAAGPGWKLSGTPALRSGVGFALDENHPSAVVKPGLYSVSAQTPDGKSLIGVERLDLSKPECIAFGSDAISAPESCWLHGDGASQVLAQGEHQIFRAVAVAPGEMPTIPVTGGMGSWIYLVAGSGALAFAGTAILRRRRIRRI